MSKFLMTNNIDLADYLPERFASFLEVKAWVAVENRELNRLLVELERIFKNRYILEADEQGISRYEKLFDIVAKGTLEERRKRIFYEWNKVTVNTYRSLRDFLDVVVGVGNYKLTLKPEQFFIQFDIYPNFSPYTEVELKNMLRTILPANLAVLVRMMVHASLFVRTRFAEHRFSFVYCGEVFAGEYY